MTFDEAFARTISHEGGYTAGKGDLGGETKFGISHRAYPTLDIPSLTLEDARAIYLRDYWGPAGCDAVPDGIKADLFDTAVNSGVSRAVKLLQRAVGEAEDGILGPRTLQSINAMSAPRLVAWFNGARLAFMAGLAVWPTFSRGWALRIADNLLNA
jgi:lysozyme family protein